MTASTLDALSLTIPILRAPRMLLLLILDLAMDSMVGGKSNRGLGIARLDHEGLKVFQEDALRTGCMVRMI